MNFSELYS